MIFVLDTSVIGFAEQRFPTTMRRLNEALAVEENDVVTTIVTVEERLNGWLPVCRRAKDGRQRAEAYASLQKAIELLLSRKWLPFDDKAANIFDQLRAQKIRIGTNDLAIAAITLSVNGILITRNTIDFERVPNLTIEDWTK